MNHTTRGTAAVALAAFVLVVTCLQTDAPARSKVHADPPDLTQGGQPDDTRDWRLGPLGANGWVFAHNARSGASQRARQVLITRVDRDGPSEGLLQTGDVIVGIGEKMFESDARKALAAAINEAEKNHNKGALNLSVFRWGKTIPVMITLATKGTHSETMPFRCGKTDRIVNEAVDYIKANRDTLLTTSWIGHINGLGLLATGRQDVMPLVRDLAHRTCLKKGQELSVEKHVSMVMWDWSYRTLFLAEYYLATGDETVLGSIEELATKMSMGQSGAGTWGHTYAARENTGSLHGHLGGYGAINQTGLTAMIALVLAKKCGVDNDELNAAIKRGNDFFGYFIDKGTIPYGDHGANNKWFDDNGKSAQGAILFSLQGHERGARFFSEMVIGSTPAGREEGHTGHFWSRLWGGMGAARAGDRGTQVFFQQINPLYTLERQPSGRFAFQDNVGEAGSKGDPKTKWDSTGSRLLSLCLPRRAIYITGKGMSSETFLTDDRIERLLHAGRIFGDKAARAKLTEDEVFDLLRDPLPPVRAIGARALAEQGVKRVDRIITLLESDNRYARLGAAEALGMAGFGDKAAAEKLIALMAESDDIDFQTYAIKALINRDKERGLLAVAEPAIPVLLDMMVKHHPDDPRRVLQHDIGRALFYNGRAQPFRGLLVEYGLDKADRAKLLPAISELLTNENGWGRSLLGWVYQELTDEELNRLWGDIYMATREIAPSGIMFASGIRTAGLKLMAEHRIDEGLDLAAWYIRYQKGHGSAGRLPHALEAILAYGPHARRVIPELEQHAKWYESRRRAGRVSENDPANQIRDAIEKIKAMPAEPKDELISIAEYLEDVGPLRR